MMHRWLRLIPFGLLILTITACSDSSDTPNFGTSTTDSQSVTREIGNFLFVPLDPPTFNDDPSATGDLIRVPHCHFTPLDRSDVPSKEDGTIEWLGVEAPVGEVISADKRDRFVHPRTKQVFVRLRPGERVQQGQVIAMLNDDRATLECNIARDNIEGAKQDLKAATYTIQYYQKNVEIEVKAGSSTQAVVAAQANLAKSISEESSKKWTVERTKGEEKKALEKRDIHFIKAPFDGEVVQLYKHVGESVKAGEPILQIQNINKLGIEGNLEVQFASKVPVGTTVFLEPSLMEPPVPLRSPHASSKPITAVAAGIRKGGKQVIVSASEDGWVHVWDSKTVHASWKHNGAVRALAVTRRGVETSYILTGCDDGKAKLYSLENLSQEPARALEGHHEGGVQAAAFSPNGAFCVTADDRGDIFLFDVATGELKFTFPREHTATVTSLHFTPQCRVISAGRDGVAQVWKVGEKSAEIEATFDNRSGEVASLGVTDDGGQMILDLDKSRLRLIDIATQRNRGTLTQANENKFTTFAHISPVLSSVGDRVIMTTGGDGVIQLWRWTSGIGRGSELKKLVCTGYNPATCAAFSPIADQKTGFIVAGTRNGDVLVWTMPTPDEMVNRFKARVTHVSANLEASGKTVRIHAEIDNPDSHLRLRPGSTATMVIPPAQ